MVEGANGGRLQAWQGQEAYRWVAMVAVAIVGFVGTRLLTQLDSVVTTSQRTAIVADVLKSKVGNLEVHYDELNRQIQQLESTVDQIIHTIDDHARIIQNAQQYPVEPPPQLRSPVPHVRTPSPEQRARQKWERR